MSRWHKFPDVADLPERAFRRSGKKMTLEGGGGGTTTATTYTTNLPEYAKPYFEDIMGRGQQASLTPYQQYGGQRVAGFSPYQQAAQQMTGQIAMGGTPQGLQQGQQMTTGAADRFANYNYTPMQAQFERITGARMDPVERVTGAQMGPFERVQALGLKDLSMQAAPDIAAQQVTSGQLGPQLSAADSATVGQFMSPYQQQVVDVEKAAAARDYQLAQQARNAQAARAGAFGGSRQAVESAEAQRGLMTQLQGIQAKGSQDAYTQAQQALQAQRAAEMQAGTTNIQSALQAALANQQSGLTAAQANQQARQQAALQNLSAALQTQGLQAQTGLQAQQANQQAGLTTAQQNAQMMQQANLANQQVGLTTAQQNAQMMQQANLANQQAFAEAQKMAEQSRQFGATSGLDAARGLGAMGAQMGQMGEAEQKLAFERASQLGQAGQQQQALQQQQLDQAYQDFAAQRDYEQNMLNWYNQILRGTPVSMNQSVYGTTPSPSAASQLLGTGLAGLGMYNQLK